jgi:hypothetical protein
MERLMKNAAVLLLPLFLGGCIVASEKPNLDTSMIVPSRTTTGQAGNGVATPTATLTLPATCWPSDTSTSPEPTTPLHGSAPSAAGGSDHTAATQGADATLGAGAAKPAAPTTPSAATLARNKCIYLIKTAIDASYLDYRLRIAKQVGLTNEGLDVGMAATSAAATATGGIANKVLSGLTSTLTGSRAAFNNDALYQASLQAVFKQMDADRLNAWASMQISMQADVDAYPSEQADNDLVAYYRAGTVEAAVNSLDANAGTASTACKTASDMVGNAVNSARQGATAQVQPPSQSTAVQGAGSSTAEQCNQLTQAANYALGELPAKPESVITEAKTISANVFKIPTGNKAELDDVAKAVGVPVSSDFSTESLAIREALAKITDITTLNQVADRIKTATGRDFTSAS